MSRSKKNWDVLIDADGNYYDLSAISNPQKGVKGLKGAKGDKGGAASPFIYKGEVPDYGSLPVGGDEGFVYKTADDGKFYVSDGFGNYTELTGVTALKGEKGLEGTKGEKGEGVKGDKGDQGEKGIDGDKGEVGDKGEKGEVGDKGIKGEKGEKGDDGEKGQKGEEPDKGEKGEVGVPGASGDKGTKGTKGTKGAKGAQATAFTFKGEVPDFGSLPGDAEEGDVYKTDDDGKFYASDGSGNWVELPGVTALKGQKGEEGDKGEKGQKGESVKGEKGQKGDKGEVGPKGPNTLETFIEEGQLPKGSTIDDLQELLKGEKGEKGFKGDQGEKGEKGEKGESGDKGLKGEDGDKGDKGDKGQKGDDLDPNLYYNKGEIDGLLTQFPLKGDVYTKGQVQDILIAYYTKGEITNVLTDYYTKGETYNRNYIDAKDNNRYTKGEVDALIAANSGTEYSYEVVPGSDETATLRLTNLRDNATQDIPIQATSQVGLSVQGGKIVIGENLTAPLNYQGSIEAPTDPSTLDSTPADGHFFIYTLGGTAWNGDTVTVGDWVIYDGSNGWQNIDQDTDIGVASVDVSGGILSLDGTAADPVINLEPSDLEPVCDPVYLRLDGTNTFTGNSLQMQATGGSATKINDNNGLDLCTGNVARLEVAPDKVTLKESLVVGSGNLVHFEDSVLINTNSSSGGSLTITGATILAWDTNGIYASKYLDMSNKKISNVADPTSGKDAVNKNYVDASMYVLPTATKVTLGGIKVGDSLSMSLDGTLDVDPDGTFLPLTGGTLSGYTKVQGALFKIRYDSAGTAGEFKFYSKDDQNIVRMVGGDTAADGYMTYNGKCDTGTHVLSRDHGDARYLQLSGGTITGALTVNVGDTPGSGKPGLLVKGKDAAGDSIDLLRSYHQNDNTRATADAVNYTGRTDNSDNLINRAALDAAIAGISGAELATQSVAGVVKVNVTTSETAGVDAVYREGAGKLFVRTAATGTSNNSTSGTQRGVAAFHSDSFAGSNGFITLKAATTSKMGGVKASSSSTDSSAAFCIDSDGKGKIRNNSASTVGVGKRGIICTKSGAPSSSDYTVGQMVLRTDSFAVYIKV